MITNARLYYFGLEFWDSPYTPSYETISTYARPDYTLAIIYSMRCALIHHHAFEVLYICWILL